MKLNKKEQAVIKFIANHERGMVTLEEIADVLYTQDRPRCWRGCVATMLRILSYKTAGQPISVVRSSALGRGNRATYQVINARFRQKEVFLLGATG